MHMVYAVENSEYYDGDPVDVAVVPSGTVRDTYTKGGCHGRTGLQFIFTWNWEGWAGGLSADQRLSDRKRIETCGGN